MPPSATMHDRLVRCLLPRPLNLTGNGQRQLSRYLAVRPRAKFDQFTGIVFHSLSPTKDGSIELAVARDSWSSEPAPSFLDAVRHHDHLRDDRQRGPARGKNMADKSSLVKSLGASAVGRAASHFGQVAEHFMMKARSPRTRNLAYRIVEGRQEIPKSLRPFSTQTQSFPIINDDVCCRRKQPCSFRHLRLTH